MTPQTLKTPRADGAQLLTSYTTTADGGGPCMGCGNSIPASAYHECWRLIENGKQVTEGKTVTHFTPSASLTPQEPK
jgi:hypothetical protein